jgi:hypothetical protein
MFDVDRLTFCTAQGQPSANSRQPPQTCAYRSSDALHAASDEHELHRPPTANRQPPTSPPLLGPVLNVLILSVFRIFRVVPKKSVIFAIDDPMR